MTYLATNVFLADGAKTFWDFEFAGVSPDSGSGTLPYLYPADVKALELYKDTEGNAAAAERLVYIDPALPLRANIVGLPVAAGRQIKIYRSTEIRFPLVDYRDRQTVSEFDLDLANRQAIFVAQETQDAASNNMALDKNENYDVKGRRIVNLANGVDDGDAVNLNQLKYAIRVPEGQVPALPEASVRAGKILTFDAAGMPQVTVAAPGSAIDLEQRLALPTGSTLVGHDAFTLEKVLDDLIATTQTPFLPTHLTYVPGTPLAVPSSQHLIDYAGKVYRVRVPAVFPVTLTGTWATDEATVIQVAASAVNVVDFGNSLRLALAAGEMVRVPATVTSLSVSATDSPYVLPNLYRVSAEGDLVINLGTGQHVVSEGALVRIGVRNSTIKLRGVAPTETKATGVTTVTGATGDWAITYQLVSAAGIAVGDFAKLFDAGPLPLLNGDNAASYILRQYPLKGELYTPLAQSVGTLTYANGGGSVAFSSVSGALTQYMQPGDLLTSQGQTLPLNVIGGTSASVVGAWANGGATGTRAFYLSRPNSGTIGTGGVPSVTVTGASSLFLTEGQQGDVLLAAGGMHRITGIASDGSLTVASAITLPAGTPYSILQSASVLHEGIHEVTAVDLPNNRVTLRNYSKVKPPIIGVSIDEFRTLKTVLKQTGLGDGIVSDQNGSLRELDNVAIVGPGTTLIGPVPTQSSAIGVLLQSRIPSELAQGVTSFGDVTQHGLRGTLLCGENVGVTRFYRGAMIGHGCLLNGRKMAFTNPIEHGVWTLEGGMTNARRMSVTGAVIGFMVNAGGIAVVTEIRLAGCSNDGMRTDANATVYGEAPMSVANGGMNYRGVDSTKMHLTDGVSLLSLLSGFYLDGGSARLDRMAVGANGRCGIELGELAVLHADGSWVSGTSNTAGSGYGVQIGAGSTFMSTSGAFVKNFGGDVVISANIPAATGILRSCYYPGPVGVLRVNSPNANGSVVYDGAGVDIGSSVPVVGSSGGAGLTTTAVSLNWTRDKNRYDYDVQLTISAIGTASGYMTVSLPFAVNPPQAIVGNNQSTGAVVTGYATNTEARLFSGAAGFPGTTGNLITFSGSARA